MFPCFVMSNAMAQSVASMLLDIEQCNLEQVQSKNMKVKTLQLSKYNYIIQRKVRGNKIMQKQIKEVKSI